MPRLSQPVHVAATSFEQAGAEVLRELQAALAELVAALPGRNARAVDLTRTLDLDKKLGWQLFSFATTPRPLEEIALVPGAPSMRRILAAATRRHVRRAVTDRVAAAFEAFESFVAEHGRDREELVLLARGLSTDVDQSHDLKVRKSVFRGLAHVWGVRAQTIVRTAVVHAGPPGPNRVDDVLVVVGYVGLQRLRRGAPFALGSTVGVQSHPANNHPAAPSPDAPAPTAVAPAIGPMELLPEYSSRPLPEMVSRVDSAGDVETEFLFPPSGRAGAVTLCTAQRIASAWSGSQAQHGLNTLVKVPTETYIFELLVPTGWTDPATARVAVYGRRGAVEQVHDLRSIDLLPQRETVACIPALNTHPFVPEAPHHHEAVATMLSRLGWNQMKFDLYRCTVSYPVLHTMVRIAADSVPAP